METEAHRATRRRRVKHALVASVAGIIVLALVEIDVYRVHGSSMRPVLEGSTSDADYVVALAHLQHARALRRFDIVIHDRPAAVRDVAEASDLGGDRCVKRIVAFPGERPVIRDGDLFIESLGEDGAPRLERARRDPETIRAMTSVVDSLRSAIHPGSRFMPSGAIYFDEDSWRARSNGATDSMPTRLEYDGLIPDTQIGRDGAFDPNGAAVNDTGLELAITEASPDLELIVELREQGDVFRVHVGQKIGLRIEYRRGAARHEVLFSSEEDILLSSPFVLRTLNCDDRILVWVNDDLVCDQEYGHNDDVFGVARNDPSFEVLAGSVEFTSVSILRDAYYLTETPLAKRGERFDEVAADAYFVLGDNSRKSIDSRDFGSVDRGAVRGVPFLRHRPAHGWSGL